MTIRFIAFTDTGFALAQKLASQFEEALACRCETGQMNGWTQAHFHSDSALVFIGAAGIAVRAIAPFVKSKTADPAVVVIDETGRFVIPLLSGHIGGANRLARQLAQNLGAIPVLTTATDCRGVFAIDTWASERGIRIVNPQQIKWVSARLLAGEPVRIKSVFPIDSPLPKGLTLGQDDYDVIIAVKNKGRKNVLRLVPPVVTLGIGCRKGIFMEDIETAFDQVLKKINCRPEAVCRVCSIDLKAGEPGLLAFCQAHRLPFQTFSAAQLRAVKGRFSSSEFVLKTTGVDNVCERSAVLGSGGAILAKKHAGNGIAMALAAAPYTIRFTEDI